MTLFVYHLYGAIPNQRLCCINFMLKVGTFLQLMSMDSKLKRDFISIIQFKCFSSTQSIHPLDFFEMYQILPPIHQVRFSYTQEHWLLLCNSSTREWGIMIILITHPHLINCSNPPNYRTSEIFQHIYDTISDISYIFKPINELMAGKLKPNSYIGILN